MLIGTKRIIFSILGWISVVLGIIGALLPIVPTTPFLILAAYFFSESSPRVHKWLTSLPYCGDAIIDWEQNKVIRPKAKAMSCVITTIIFGSTIIFAGLNIWLNVMLVCIWLAVMTFILTRNSSL